MSDKPQVVYTVDANTFVMLENLQEYGYYEVHRGDALYLQAVIPAIAPDLRFRMTPVEDAPMRVKMELLKPFKVEWRVQERAHGIIALPKLEKPEARKYLHGEWDWPMIRLSGIKWAVDEADCRAELEKEMQVGLDTVSLTITQA